MRHSRACITAARYMTTVRQGHLYTSVGGAVIPSLNAESFHQSEYVPSHDNLLLLTGVYHKSELAHTSCI